MELMGTRGLSYWRRSNNNNKKKLLVVSTRSSGGWLVLWFLLLVLMIIDDYNNYININDDKLFRRPRLIFVVGARQQQQPLVLVHDLLLPQQRNYQLLPVGAAHPLAVEEAIKINKKRPRRHQQRHGKDYFEKMLGISCKCITTACDDDDDSGVAVGARGREECNKMMINTSTSTTTMGKQDCYKLECLPWKLS